MGALATVALVWLAAQPPSGHTRASLESWAAGRGLALAEPLPERATDEEAGIGIAEQCDRSIANARDEITAGDETNARATLDQVEQSLREHPEVRQASWLMAEAYRLRAQLAHGTAEASAWIVRAEVLEGVRAPAFGEKRVAETGSTVAVTLAVRGARSHQAFWDGAIIPDRVETAPGEHHLVVVRGRRIAWSGWVSALSPATIAIWIGDAAPCSAEDLDGVSFTESGEVAVPSGVRCPRWVAAADQEPLGFRAAACQRDTCERVTVSVEYGTALAPEPERARKFPSWATWTIAGVGVAAATTLVLWRAGVFDRSTPATRVVYDGSHL